MIASHSLFNGVTTFLVTILLISTGYSAEQIQAASPATTEVTTAASISSDIDNSEDFELPPPRAEVVDAAAIQVDAPVAEELSEEMELPAPHPSTKPWVGASLRNDRPEILVVTPRSPAEAAGLLSGDLLEMVQSKRVRSTKDVIEKLSSQQPGEQLRLIIWRGGSRWSATLTLGNQSERDVVLASQK